MRIFRTRACLRLQQRTTSSTWSTARARGHNPRQTPTSRYHGARHGCQGPTKWLSRAAPILGAALGLASVVSGVACQAGKQGSQASLQRGPGVVAATVGARHLQQPVMDAGMADSRPVVIYELDTSVVRHHGRDAQGAVQRGAHAWTDPRVPRLSIRHAQPGSAPALHDGRNSIWSARLVPAHILACAFTRKNAEGTEIIERDIVISSENKFCSSTNGPQACSSEHFDLQRLMSHEFGHGFGFPDVDDPDAIMSGTLESGRMSLSHRGPNSTDFAQVETYRTRDGKLEPHPRPPPSKKPKNPKTEDDDKGPKKPACALYVPPG